MPTPLIIALGLSGLLPLGIMATKGNTTIVNNIDTYGKRVGQLDYIKEMFNSREDKNNVFDALLELTQNVLDNNSYKKPEDIDIEVINILWDELEKQNRHSDTSKGSLTYYNNIVSDLDEIRQKYKENIIEIKREKEPNDSATRYDYIIRALKHPFHVLIQLIPYEDTKIITEILVEETGITIADMFKTLFETDAAYYKSPENTLLNIILKYYNDTGDETLLSDQQKENISKKLVAKEKEYRDKLTKQAQTLYPYYFDITRNKDTKLKQDDYFLGAINTKISGLHKDSTLQNLVSIIELDVPDEIRKYSKTFVNFIRFVSDDLAKLKQMKMLENDILKRNTDKQVLQQQQRDIEKKTKKYNDEDILLMLLFLEE